MCAVLSSTSSTGRSHIVVHTKFVLVEQATPAALARTDVSKSVPAVSFGDLDSLLEPAAVKVQNFNT